MTKDRGELAAGILSAAFGLFVIREARRLPYVSEFGPGPGFFPMWIGIGIFIGALAMLYVCLFGKESGERAARGSRGEIGRALAAWAAFALTVALMPFLGFVLGLGLLTAFLLLVMDRRTPWVAAAVALGLMAGFHLVFNVALGVSLPSGPLGF
ncbi:MAG TPA: tripartite tricarboxylate transporter TctB family protein [candidate division Zixibacteria bacterium]|nr:tripartite tricarboxylate transporter TctB family protein [candidate division Zixibacteria bacterium]